MSDQVKEELKPKSKADELAELELQIKKAQLEELELSKQERQYSLRDLKSRLAERDVKELQKKEDREAQGRTFAQDKRNDEYKWKICTHKKGGNVSARDLRVLSTGGNAAQYAVIKHQMINGDIWVRCLRCGKTWSPPIEDRFYFDENGKEMPKHLGKFDKARFDKACLEYQTAVQFETNNSPSASVQARFSRRDPATGNLVDASDVYRGTLANTTLR